jgi:hypothetical protein
MDKPDAHINLFPQNYWCIGCASLQGLRVPADYIIWDEEEQKAIPLCEYCHGMTAEDTSFFSVFSVN